MRQAFVILAHGKWPQLQLLLGALNVPEFDVYLHIDADAALPDGWLEQQQKACANLHLVPRLRTYWADVSLVDLELRCFDAVLNSGRTYSHIHLLSGQDLPLRSPGDMASFFSQHPTTQFVHAYEGAKNNLTHVRCHYIFTHSFQYKSGSRLLYRLRRMANQLYHALQKMALVHRWRRCHIPFRKGSQWCSITPDFARYLVSRRDELLALYAHTFAPDEFFLTTALVTSPFAADWQNDNLRYICWSGQKHTPHPNIITMADAAALQTSQAFFARKFDADTDAAIVHLVLNKNE